MSGRLVSLARKTEFNNAPAKNVLVYLADRFNDDTGECFPLINTICRDTGYSEREIQRLLQVFVAIDLIGQTPREFALQPGKKPDRRRRAYDFAFNLTLLGTDLSEFFGAKWRAIRGKKDIQIPVPRTGNSAENTRPTDGQKAKIPVPRTGNPRNTRPTDGFSDSPNKERTLTNYRTLEKPEQTRARPPRAVENTSQRKPPQPYIPDPEHLPGPIDEIYQRCRAVMQMPAAEMQAQKLVTLEEMNQATHALIAWKKQQQKENENAGRDTAEFPPRNNAAVKRNAQNQLVNRCREGAAAWTEKANFGGYKKQASAGK